MLKLMNHIKAYAYSHDSAPKRRQSYQPTASTSASVDYGEFSCNDWDLTSPMAPPPSTISPSSMHLRQTVDQFEPNGLSDGNDIDKFIASLTGERSIFQDNELFSQTAPQRSQFNQELPSSEDEPNLDLPPRVRFMNEPWIPTSLDNTILQPPLAQRGSNSNYPSSVCMSMPKTINTQMSCFNPITNAPKAYTECNFGRLDSGYGSKLSPCTMSLRSTADATNQSILNGDMGNQQSECPTITNELRGLDCQSQSSKIPHFDPFGEDNETITIRPPSDIIQIVAPSDTVMDVPPWKCTQCDHPDFKNKSEFKYSHLIPIISQFAC